MTDLLTKDQVHQVEEISELQTRRYFDQYLQKVWPVQQKAAREHTHLMIEQHDANPKAHGGVEFRLNKMIWMLVGVAGAGGAAGGGIAKIISVFGG